MKPSLYLETTIPSYLVSKPSRDMVVAARQELTRQWWDRRRADFRLANAEIFEDIEEICRLNGRKCPIICTPEELLGGEL